MSTAMAPQYNPKGTEEKIYRLWEESGFFNPDKLPLPLKRQAKNRKKTFTIVAPPPNVTGSLHLGHALNAVIQDILIRKKRMEGYKTLWLPGTDHAGIATQNVVEKELKKEGKTRHDLGREKLVQRIWEWKEKYGNIILDQFKKLGSSMDWSRTRFTMDKGYQKAVEEAFLNYYEKGWIYRAERVINWCTRCQTSLSDLELEYKEVETKLYYIRYPVVEKSQITNHKSQTNSKFIVVATTRPETMLGDAAVAVNPKDQRYKKLVGEKVTLPIQNREIPVVADDAVEMEFGTGAVKVTPSHDLLDAEIAERHSLPRHTVIDKFGKMTNEAGTICKGLKAGECREKVVEELIKQGLLEREEPYTHNVAICYRCAATIEPIPSLQWFLKMKELANLAEKAVKSGKVKFHPERWQKVYLDWLEHVRDWTISRQIWWGHQIPIWYCRCEGEKQTVFAGRTPPKIKCAACQADWMRDPDVLDTWFSSALWPFAVFGWPIACAQNQKSKIKNKNTCVPQSGTDLERFYPTQVLSTARDIINLWVTRMVFSGKFFTGKEPFSDVIIHATILTKEGKRMSKSLGTGVDPMVLIGEHCSDALRFGLIWQAMGTQDIHWSEEHVRAGMKFANKLWNIARFIAIKTDGKVEAENTPPAVSDETGRVLLEKLEKIKKEADNDIEKYNFGQALHTIHDFAWHDFADKYIEYSKTKSADEAGAVLSYTLVTLLKLLHPFMPFLTEEIWSHLPIKKKNVLMVEEWPITN